MNFRDMMRNAGNTMKREALDLLAQGVYSPIKSQAVSELSTFTSTIGNFVIEKIKGRYQRAVSLYINETNKWMDEALHIILRKYNNLEKESNSLILTTSVSDKENTYYQLAPGEHILKYRDFTIMVSVNEPSTSSPFSDPTRNSAQRTYMIVTFDLSDAFPKMFNTDMLKYRNVLLKIDPDSPYVNVYSNAVSQYSDTYSVWSFTNRIPKKPIDDLYIPQADKVKLFTEINTFFASQQDYRDRGITPNFVIVLYGPPGPQPLSEEIPITDGWKKMGDLQVGDRVWTADWKPTTITNINDYGEMPVYELTVRGGGKMKKTRCAATHKWPIVDNINPFLMGLNGMRDEKVDPIIVEKTTEEIMEELAWTEDSILLRPVMLDGDMTLNYIWDIKKLDYSEPMRCITVDDPSHLYLTHDYIPTCNSGKDSVARTIASAYNRNLYLPTLGNGGKYIPRSIEANADNLNISSPMFLISDIDKFPYLINEQPWVETKNNPDEMVRKRIQDNIMMSKQLYNRMINALDGIMTGDGWIIVMTTNNIDAFSKTFLRDGRVDLCMEIGYVTPEVFRTFVFRNYGIALPSDIKLKSKELVMSTLIADQLYRKMKGDEFIAKYVKEKK